MERQVIQASDSKLEEFFIDQLRDIYWAEQKLVKTLPKMEAAATDLELKDAFVNHFKQTQIHVERLERVFGMIGEEVRGSRCAAMVGLVEEGEDIIDETQEGSAQRDVGLIFAGQKAEHYEIATYGGLVSLAKMLGHEDAASLLSLTLSEEKDTDSLLNRIAESQVNYQACLEPR